MMPLIIIIAIICIIKFHPKFLTITDFLGITDEKVSNLISYIELFIEFGFLYFVLKEFKMTRKSFELQEDNRANQKLEKIIKYFLREFIQKVFNNLPHSLGTYVLNSSYQILEEECKKWSSKLLNEVLNEFTEKFQDTQKEKDTVRKITNFIKKKYSLRLGYSVCYYVHSCYREDIKEPGMELYKKIETFFSVPSETAKHMGIDYKILEKIYNNILYKDYDDQKTN